MIGSNPPPVPSLHGSTHEAGQPDEFPVTNLSGRLADIQPALGFLHKSFRYYCYADTRWVTSSNPNYGPNYFQALESGLTGAEPVYEWEHLGSVMPENTTYRKLRWWGRVNNVEVTDLEMRIVYRIPNPITGYTAGVDADGEQTVTVLFSGNWWEPSWGGANNDLHYKEIDLGNVTVPEVSMFSVYVKPIRTGTGTRYFFSTWSLEYSK